MWNKDGYQVLLSAHNAEENIKMCLESLDSSLKDYNWVLLIGDDASTDNTILEIKEYIPNSTAQKVHLFNFNKADTVGQAKNRLIKECFNYKDDYPAILMMDADDQMTKERPKMLETAKKHNAPYVVGCWQAMKKLHMGEAWTRSTMKTSDKAVKGLRFGPWATLFHYSLLPEDGRFFPDAKTANYGYEDLLAWNHLKYIQDITPIAHTANTSPVHIYYIYPESESHTKDKTKTNLMRNSYWGIRDMIIDKRDIYKNPPSKNEVEVWMNKYIARKKAEKEPPHPLESKRPI